MKHILVGSTLLFVGLLFNANAWLGATEAEVDKRYGAPAKSFLVIKNSIVREYERAIDGANYRITLTFFNGKVVKATYFRLPWEYDKAPLINKITAEAICEHNFGMGAKEEKVEKDPKGIRYRWRKDEYVAELTKSMLKIYSSKEVQAMENAINEEHKKRVKMDL